MTRPAKLELEGIVSKRADAPYAPGNRGLWLKVKCLHREEFVVVGWTDPEGKRPWLGASLVERVTSAVFPAQPFQSGSPFVVLRP
jgi:bifunctional non-homologous end joining protein LigD